MKRVLGVAFALFCVALVGGLFLWRLTYDPVPGLDAGAKGEALEMAATLDVTTLLWYLIAAVAVASAAMTAFHPNIVYAALALLGSFGAVAAMFIYLSADFLAVAQVAVYIGGILVLILFAVMLTNRIGVDRHTNPSIGLPIAGGLATALLGVLLYVAVEMPWQATEPGPMQPTIEGLGNAFLQEYLLPFEVASVLLVAVIIGAVIIVRKEVRPEHD